MAGQALPTRLARLPTDVKHADPAAQISITSPAQQAVSTPGGRPVNIDIADLTLGRILGKGSFAVVSCKTVCKLLVRLRISCCICHLLYMYLQT